VITRRAICRAIALVAATSCWTSFAAAADQPGDEVLKPGRFPTTPGKYIAGELVFIDPVNRRGGIRLDGDGGQRYHDGPLHHFAILPFGSCSYCGAPAELRDIPLGTHVHGYFFLPPEGEEQTIPPLPAEHVKYRIKHNHAVSLEDDFSFYSRRGRAWKITALDRDKGKLNVEAVGPPVSDSAKDLANMSGGIIGPYTFDINDSVKLWQDRRLIELDAFTPEPFVKQTPIQLNLIWSQGWRDKEFTVGELWLDEASRAAATEMQRRRHVRYEQQRWLPGWIDAVEHNDYGGGTVTLTLFGGQDASLYADLKRTQDKGFGVAASDKTLRTWAHRSDKKIGQVLEWKESPNPPAGSSGIQVRLKFTELLEGYRPGRCVRVKCHDWTFVSMPPEERFKSLDDVKRASVMTLPQ
jgi:hypothetical protein